MTSKEQIIADTTIASVGSKTTYTGTGMTLFGWMTLNDLALISGIACAVLGLLVNWYYKRKAYKLAESESQWRRDQGWAKPSRMPPDDES